MLCTEKTVRVRILPELIGNSIISAENNGLLWQWDSPRESTPQQHNQPGTSTHCGSSSTVAIHCFSSPHIVHLLHYRKILDCLSHQRSPKCRIFIKLFRAESITVPRVKQPIRARRVGMSTANSFCRVTGHHAFSQGKILLQIIFTPSIFICIYIVE